MTQEQQKQLSNELNLRIVLLQQRLAVLDELLLHQSRQVDPETASYYVQVLNKYGNFFNAITNSLKSSLYVELLAVLGVKLNRSGQLIADRWATASIYNLALQHDMKDEYVKLVEDYKTGLVLIDDVRHHIAHATKLEELNALYVPGYNHIVELLNRVAEFVMTIHDDLHGIPGLNKPHTLEEENPYADDTESLISAIASSSESKEMRIRYADAKSKMRRGIITSS
jgi:hypothetical protein